MGKVKARKASAPAQGATVGEDSSSEMDELEKNVASGDEPSINAVKTAKDIKVI